MRAVAIVGDATGLTDNFRASALRAQSTRVVIRCDFAGRRSGRGEVGGLLLEHGAAQPGAAALHQAGEGIVGSRGCGRCRGASGRGVGGGPAVLERAARRLAAMTPSANVCAGSRWRAFSSSTNRAAPTSQSRVSAFSRVWRASFTSRAVCCSAGSASWAAWDATSALKPSRASRAVTAEFLRAFGAGDLRRRQAVRQPLRDAQLVALGADVARAAPADQHPSHQGCGGGAELGSEGGRHDVKI